MKVKRLAVSCREGIAASRRYSYGGNSTHWFAVPEDGSGRGSSCWLYGKLPGGFEYPVAACEFSEDVVWEMACRELKGAET